MPDLTVEIPYTGAADTFTVPALPPGTAGWDAVVTIIGGQGDTGTGPAGNLSRVITALWGPEMAGTVFDVIVGQGATGRTGGWPDGGNGGTSTGFGDGYGGGGSTTFGIIQVGGSGGASGEADPTWGDPAPVPLSRAWLEHLAGSTTYSWAHGQTGWLGIPGNGGASSASRPNELGVTAKRAINNGPDGPLAAVEGGPLEPLFPLPPYAVEGGTGDVAQGGDGASGDGPGGGGGGGGLGGGGGGGSYLTADPVEDPPRVDELGVTTAAYSGTVDGTPVTYAQALWWGPGGNGGITGVGDIILASGGREDPNGVVYVELTAVPIPDPPPPGSRSWSIGTIR